MIVSPVTFTSVEDDLLLMIIASCSPNHGRAGVAVKTCVQGLRRWKTAIGDMKCLFGEILENE